MGWFGCQLDSEMKYNSNCPSDPYRSLEEGVAQKLPFAQRLKVVMSLRQSSRILQLFFWGGEQVTTRGEIVGEETGQGELRGLK